MVINKFINIMSNKYPKIFIGVGSIVFGGYALFSYNNMKNKYNLIEKNKL